MKINKEKNFVPCGLTSFQAKFTIAVVKEKKKREKNKSINTHPNNSWKVNQHHAMKSWAFHTQRYHLK